MPLRQPTKLALPLPRAGRASAGPGVKRCPGRVSSQAGKEFWQGAQDTWHLLFPLSTAAKNTNSKLALRASESSVCAQEGGIRVGFLRKELWSPLLHSSE